MILNKNGYWTRQLSDNEAPPEPGTASWENIIKRGCSTPFHQEQCEDEYEWECEKCPVMIERGRIEALREKAGYGTW